MADALMNITRRPHVIPERLHVKYGIRCADLVSPGSDFPKALKEWFFFCTASRCACRVVKTASVLLAAPVTFMTFLASASAESSRMQSGIFQVFLFARCIFKNEYS